MFNRRTGSGAPCRDRCHHHSDRAVVVMSNLQFAAITDRAPSVAMEVMATLAQRLRDAQAA